MKNGLGVAPYREVAVVDRNNAGPLISTSCLHLLPSGRFLRQEQEEEMITDRKMDHAIFCNLTCGFHPPLPVQVKASGFPLMFGFHQQKLPADG